MEHTRRSRTLRRLLNIALVIAVAIVLIGLLTSH